MCRGGFPLSARYDTDFDDTLEEVSEEELATLLNKLSQTPLLMGEGIRLSLAGAQEKLALTIFPDDDKYYKPSDKYISTWILKPENRNFPDLIYNEYFCMKLAGLMGLNVAECKIRMFGSVTAYMTKRFDRQNTVQRIQQEDFCQGLGLSNKNIKGLREDRALSNVFSSSIIIWRTRRKMNCISEKHCF